MILKLVYIFLSPLRPAAVISTTGHENHCLLINCDFAMIAKCLESFTSSFKGFGVVRYDQNWCASSPCWWSYQIPPAGILQSHVSVLEKIFLLGILDFKFFNNMSLLLLWLYYTRNDVNHILFTDLTELCKILFTSSFQGLKGVS